MQKIMKDTMTTQKQATEWMREHFNFITAGTPLYHQIHQGLQLIGTSQGLQKDVPAETPLAPEAQGGTVEAAAPALVGEDRTD